MFARILWHLDPLLSLAKKKKVGPPLAKLSGSAHVYGGVAELKQSMKLMHVQ